MLCRCKVCEKRREERRRAANAALIAHTAKWRVINARVALGVSLYVALTDYNNACQG